MVDTPLPKSLSHDEKKAAEAAFTRRPFDESWSTSARLVYDGIVKALRRADLAVPTASGVEKSVETPPGHRDLVKA